MKIGKYVIVKQKDLADTYANLVKAQDKVKFLLKELDFEQGENASLLEKIEHLEKKIDSIPTISGILADRIRSYVQVFGEYPKNLSIDMITYGHLVKELAECSRYELHSSGFETPSKGEFTFMGVTLTFLER